MTTLPGAPILALSILSAACGAPEVTGSATSPPNEGLAVRYALSVAEPRGVRPEALQVGADDPGVDRGRHRGRTVSFEKAGTAAGVPPLHTHYAIDGVEGSRGRALEHLEGHAGLRKERLDVLEEEALFRAVVRGVSRRTELMVNSREAEGEVETHGVPVGHGRGESHRGVEGVSLPQPWMPCVFETHNLAAVVARAPALE